MFRRQKQLLICLCTGIGLFWFPPGLIGNQASNSTSRAIHDTGTVYVWKGTLSGDWQDSLSWTPTRSLPAPDDVLVFHSGGITTATNVPTQVVGQLIVSEHTSLNLQSAASVSLTLMGGPGADLVVDSGSSLGLQGENPISIDVTIGATGLIGGSITFSSAGAVPHRLTAFDAGAIVFQSGASFTAGNGFVGNPFGTTNLHSVVFESGSTYLSIAGGDPFGSPEPASVVLFRKGSLFRLQHNADNSFFSGRTYSNFEMNWPGSYPVGDVFAEGSSPLVMDDLTVTAGRFHFWMVGTENSIKGNIMTGAGTLLDFQPSFPGGTLNLNGSQPQSITILGQVGTNPGFTLVIDNPAGVTIETLFATWNLNLITGIVSVTNPNPGARFFVAGTVTRVNGYVDGNLSRQIRSTGTYTFDVGTRNGYSPLIAEVTAGHFNLAAIQVKAVQAPQPNINDPSKALTRYWQIVSLNIDEVNLLFNYLDPTDIPATANEDDFAIQKYDNGLTQPVGVIDQSANTFQINGVTSATGAWTLAEPSALFPPRTSFDFDGDGRADTSVYRSADGVWYLLESTSGFNGVSFGNPTDRIAPADFDGDGKTDIAVYRPSQGTWYWLNSSNGTLSAVPFGANEDLPVPADYDGDGRADTAVFRPSNGVWYRLNSHDGSFAAVQFGASEDKPTIGDYDGDGLADVAVFRPSSGAWYRLNSSNQQFVGVSFGLLTDLITPADFDGDGKADVAVYRPSAATWFSLDSSNGALRAVPFGTAEDVPVAADFDGDGRADVSVFRPSNGVWYRLNSGNGQFFAVQFGTSTDRPTPAAFRY